MRSRVTAALLIACLALALAVRLRRGEADLQGLPGPPGLGSGGLSLQAGTVLRGEVRLPACPGPIGYAAVPAQDVAIDPSLVAAGPGPARTVVVYGGMGMPEVFTAASVDALYLARQLAQAVGLSRASFGSAFVVRFAVPAGCGGLAPSDLARAVAPPDPAVSGP